nr:hypothetical protein [Brevibacillus fulvus]
MGLIGFFGMRGANEQHVQEIKQVIATHQGEVQHIEIVSQEDSPFGESGKGNTVFKITYAKDGKTMTAWYRANNYSSIIKEKEAWIFE